MKLKLYQVDAFTDKLFSGNPAAVCPLKEWLPDTTMQNIAMENNLAETAFYIPENNNYHIRWFTPTVEVDLCGHATLASAHVLFNHENVQGNEVLFRSRSGELKVTRQDKFLTLDFPTDTIKEIVSYPELNGCFNSKPTRVFRGKTDYMLVFASEQQIRDIRPDLHKIAGLPARGVIVTAKGNDVDFVSRFFAPQSGINEDPVTGSAHTSLIPFWHQALDKMEMTALQLSSRTGFLKCTYAGDRVMISGQACTYLVGELEV